MSQSAPLCALGIPNRAEGNPRPFCLLSRAAQFAVRTCFFASGLSGHGCTFKTFLTNDAKGCHQTIRGVESSPNTDFAKFCRDKVLPTPQAWANQGKQKHIAVSTRARTSHQACVSLLCGWRSPGSQHGRTAGQTPLRWVAPWVRQRNQALRYVVYTPKTTQ